MSKAEDIISPLAKRDEDYQTTIQNEPLFENPFHMEDLQVFDDATLKRLLDEGFSAFSLCDLARSLHGVPQPLMRRVRRNVPTSRRSSFLKELRRSITGDEIEVARRHVLDSLFWELTYWKTPDLYEELTEGERLHPGIFQRLKPDLRNKVVLDVGAGSGRATFECLRHGARLVYAVEPSPGLLRILRQKSLHQSSSGRVITLPGRFDAIPLEDESVDLALACSSFTAEPEHGGEAGLVELKRVTKPGGKVVLIWPRTQDHEWLEARGFQGVTLSTDREMKVYFKSLRVALRCAKRFYARNQRVLQYIRQHHQAEVPFSVLGFNPPRDYYWLAV
ncbi:MAG TPA: methyltransferase domain-containing protein [Ktedonobacteraceae bacterium]|nr:methyltransferase domain-containing protein [Ktedonobacteraceae bacterium]